jgi:uncharacterized protein (DUF1015 family)
VLRIKPFAALRPREDLVEGVASPPYDVMDRDEARQMAQGNSKSFLHVIRAEIGLDDAVSPYDDAVYRAAKQNLSELVNEGVFQREDSERLYLYRQEATIRGERVSQTGVVACCHVEDYLNDVIKKHEKTRQAKEDDRTRHTLAINANAGPVFLLHRDDETIAQLVEKGSEADPLYDFTAVDGVRHTVWRVDDAASYVEAFAKFEAAYVADGHHRSASAARAGKERRDANPSHTGDEEYNWFLCVLFPASALTILGYHRLVADLNGLEPNDVLATLAEVGELELIEDQPNPEPQRTGEVCLYVGGEWHKLTFPAEFTQLADPVARLDYQILYDHVLGPVLGIGDVRTDDRIDFVGGIRGTGELKKRVDEGRAGVGFAMHPVTVEQLIAVADAGKIMSPKSTWFEPKLRSGLLIHTLD